MNLNCILAIDTSCDDTSASVVKGNTILSNIIASQTQLHQPYGGVFPTVAKQAHTEHIAPAVAVALRRAGVTWQEITLLAVTQGPGLAPALEVGIDYAKKLSQEHSLPLIPINHIEGHLLSVLAQPKTKSSTRSGRKGKSTNDQKNDFPALQLPALGVIVSGGHTLFILVKQLGEYEILGTTIDDAAGEALDKIGRMMALGYPAGPVVEEFAKKGNDHFYQFPLPMTTSGDFNLSFSGIKTFSKNLLTKLTDNGKRNLSRQEMYDFAASIQYAIFRHIMNKLSKILAIHPEIQEVWLGGGVAANITLRKMIRKTLRDYSQKQTKRTATLTVPLAAPTSTIMLPSSPLLLRVPYTKRLCQDNAAMIGVAASYKKNNTIMTSSSTFERAPQLLLS